MKHETVRGLNIPKIGFGMWRIGGDSYPDPGLDSKSMTALRTALEVGYTHFDTAEAYASGHSEELLGRAIRLKNGHGFWICHHLLVAQDCHHRCPRSSPQIDSSQCLTDKRVPRSQCQPHDLDISAGVD